MARNPRIRIRDVDRKEYGRLERNAKAKLRRIEKNFGLDLSGEIVVPKIEDFTTREQFNRTMEKLQSFTNRYNQKYQFVKNKYGVITTQSDITRIELSNAREIRLAQERLDKLEKLPYIIQGKKQEGGQRERIQRMKSPSPMGIVVPNKFNFETVRTPRELERRRKGIEKRSNARFYDNRERIMQENFITILQASFNSHADEVVELLKNLSPDVFYELYQIHGDVMNFGMYDSDGQRVDATLEDLERMKTYIYEYLKGNTSMDMKGL